MAILDFSKLLIYDFYYNYMLKKYDRKKIKLCLTDTDSLCFFKLKLTMFIKIYFKIKNYLIIVITQNTVSSFLVKIRR